MLNISISHRTIKIAVLCIAVLLLAAAVIPTGSLEAGSLEITRGGLELMLPGVNEEIPASPFQAFVEDTTVQMEIKEVKQVGIAEIGDKKYGWAFVLVTSSNRRWLGFTSNLEHLELLYIPGPRLQSLFVEAISSHIALRVYAHPIAKPEGWDQTEDYTLYKVTSAALVSWDYL